MGWSGEGRDVDEVRFRLLGPMEMSVAGQAVEAARGRRACPAGPAAARAGPHHSGHHAGRPALVGVHPAGRPDERAADPGLEAASRLRAVGLEDLVAREGVGLPRQRRPGPGRRRRLRGPPPRGPRRRAGAAAGRRRTRPAILDAYDDALALWRGEPLSDFATEQWAIAEAARLTELRLAALTERAQIALALGRHHEVVADLEPVVADDPTLESLAGLLMVALYRSGRQADALEVYTRTRDVLDESLGLEPSVSLRSLHERVLRQDESLGGAARPGSTRADRCRPPARSAAARQAHSAPTNLPTVRPAR